MKVLITGHAGILGRATLETLRRSEVEAVGFDLPQMDITDAGRVAAAVNRERPEVVINCAAFTRVDECESQRELCFAINAAGAGNVAAAAAEAEARLIHISTDYVFDGNTRAPYTEEAEPRPLSAYGESKLAGEREVAAAAADHVILRTAGLYGVGGVSFVSKILTRAKAGEALRVVSDQYVSPTYAGHLAEGLGRLLEAKWRGVLHLAGTGGASWFEVAAEILRLTGYEVSLEAVEAAELGLAATRPAYSVLDCSRYAGLTGHAMPPWPEGLAAYLREIKEI
ncbi:MAG: dTDP-4-dehydrorhamnose reductase [Candidatus Coatesbacteria bacterium]|nr:MAG: dTDP-4-dehydrorhamnose reductase [Candidatus Coatesbacteria bacterium]